MYRAHVWSLTTKIEVRCVPRARDLALVAAIRLRKQFLTETKTDHSSIECALCVQ